MKHGSLFSGIGGFDLAAQEMGWKNEFHCEINPFARHILKYYWPKAKSYEDIKQTNFNVWRGRIDILTGGFPCQPFSNAGRKAGTTDNRYLWPQTLQVIKQIKPRWICLENVAALSGMVFGEEKIKVEYQATNEGTEIHEQIRAKGILNKICEEIEQENYHVESVIIPACAINAPHRRDRVWIIACNPNRHTSNKINNLGGKNSQRTHGAEQERVFQKEDNSPNRLREVSQLERTATYSHSKRLERGNNPKGFNPAKSKIGKLNAWDFGNAWQNFPTQSPICGGNDGIPYELDGITVPSRKGRRTLKPQTAFNRWRKESIKAYGNAIVPQVAYQIFKAISLYEKSIQEP